MQYLKTCAWQYVRKNNLFMLANMEHTNNWLIFYFQQDTENFFDWKLSGLNVLAILRMQECCTIISSPRTKTWSMCLQLAVVGEFPHVDGLYDYDLATV